MLSTADRSRAPKAIVLAERWRRYRRDGEREVRDQLVLAYSPIVKHVAGRIASRMPPHVDLADLVAYGLVGLIDAVERYDPARGVKFESFAGLRIRGAILDAMRSLDWVPRAVRDEARQYERTSADLLVRLQRLPTDEETAEALGIDAEELEALMLRVANSQMVALDQPWGFNGSDTAQTTLLDFLPDPTANDPAEISDNADLEDRVATAVTQLSGREQTILALRYHQDLTYAEIGEVFDVTESRISQIHTKAMLHLRVLLGGAAAAEV
ncbi:MAG: polymerase, sigma 28 subunit, FliA/WhiG [Conexibacter sp.]|nr:polymerase, sigma 28 subunit, FliA/WhiG [Conexibacter sp.]